MYAAVILAGGAARRLGGATKPALPIGGVALLSRVLAAVASARPRIVVGPPSLVDLLPPDVTLTSEDPPGGGPVAAIAAGLAILNPAVDDHLAVLAGDLPFLSGHPLDALRERLDRVDRPDGAVLADGDGRAQWLAGVWRAGPLLARLVALGDPAGQSMRRLVDGLGVVVARVAQQPGPPPWFDCDTDEDLRRAEEWARADTG